MDPSELEFQMIMSAEDWKSFARAAYVFFNSSKLFHKY